MSYFDEYVYKYFRFRREKNSDEKKISIKKNVNEKKKSAAWSQIACEFPN